MPLRLERIVYESRATGVTSSLLNLAAILGESQRNNARVGLTGALAAHNNRYIQVLEGPADNLDTLLKRLDKDPRHTDIVVLERRPIEERAFDGWSMASTRIRPEVEPVLEALMADAGPKGDRIVETLRDCLI